MSRKEPVPTVRSRRLAAYLREKRLASGLSPEQAAREADLSRMWVYRAEKPNCRPGPNNVRRVLQVYGVTDETEIAQAAALALAKAAARPGWWDRWELTADQAAFVAAEDEAAGKLAWEPSLIPGLLQTPDYAREVITSGPGALPARDVERLVRVRIERQKALVKEDPLRLSAVLDEGVLRRVTGSRALMADQLRHLAEAAEGGLASVRILPAGMAHPVMTGPFTILHYADPADHDVLHCETLAGVVYAETDEALARAHRAFAALEGASLTLRESIGLITECAATL